MLPFWHNCCFYTKISRFCWASIPYPSYRNTIHGQGENIHWRVINGMRPALRRGGVEVRFFRYHTRLRNLHYDLQFKLKRRFTDLLPRFTVRADC